jgi:hypothetical protein
VSEPTFDLDRTRRWVVGVLQDPHGTALAYRQTEAPWRATFLQIVVPVYVAAGIVGLLLSWLTGRPTLFGGMAGAPLWMLVALAWSVAYVLVVAFIFDFFAEVFGGARRYDAAVATLALAMIPAALGGALNPLPWFGWLIGLVAGIYSLVLAYQFVPVFMSVPEDKRVVHFVVSVLAAFVLNLIIAGLLGWLLMPSAMTSSVSSTPTPGGGLFGTFERQADFAEQASRDRYDPPSNGFLSEAQVRTYVRNLERTVELRERLSRRFRERDDEEISLGDLFGGVGDAVRLGTAEMEVVKSAGGNWAEHQWVKHQLEVARVQRDGSAAIEHNYALFQKYRAEIERLES